MNKGMLIVGIILLGVLTLVAVNLVQSYQSGNELDYYLLEETTEAAMIDAIDTSYYRNSGIIRMDREKFLESFIRRFAESVDSGNNYRIKVIDLNETPPKVSVEVNSSTTATFNSEDLGITNKIDAIIETKYEEDRLLQEVQ